MATARKSSGTTKSASAKKASANKSATKKPVKKPVKRPSSRDEGSRGEGSSGQDGSDHGRPSTKKASKPSAMKVARAAAAQLTELTGRRPEVVVGVERNDDGWQVELEVVESRRIPDSTDILATYRVQVDEDGEMMGYYRAQRYTRGKGGERG